ncbi:MAG: dynamin family protein [Desulfococcaceae bacterium]|jgi:hypothetical protein|nr:dynamin family protein [Desulfococcaceae bacterium]
MSVKVIISDILKKRHERVTALEVLRRDLGGLETALENLLNIAGGGQIPDDFVSVTSTVSRDLNGIQEEISHLKTSLSNLIRRFRRDTVNIGVAGAARQGKSTLLQRISGLKDTEIPTSDELPCTGAKSRIFHSEGQPHAKIDFYTENEFLKEIIHTYFDRLHLSKPSSLDSFSKPLPPPNDKDSADRNLYNAMYDRLKRIHSAFPSFREYLSKPAEVLELKDIPEYVTQSDGRTKYLAVKTANIYTKFPQQDVSGLCLVDLPGLEAAQGHEKKLADSLEHEVDAVILVKKPSPEGTQYDSDDYKVIDLIDHAVREVELADWLFLVLNLLDKGSNEKQVQLLKNDPPKTLSRFNILTGNCKEPEQVEKQVFSPVLTHLEQNLKKIDSKFVKTLSEKMKGISDRISKTVEDSKGKLKPDQGDEMQAEYQNLAEEFFDNVKETVEELIDASRPENSQIGDEFKRKIEEICSNAEENASIPTHKELEKRYKVYRAWESAVQEKLHYLRSALSEFLAKNIDKYLSEQVNDAVEKVLKGIFKDSLSSILPESAKTEDPFEMVRKILAELFDRSRLPKLYDAFDYIARFNFSYHSHFHHRVRKEMWRLDTFDGTYVDRIIPKDRSKPLEELAQEIERGLQVTYKETVYGISGKLGEEMQADPANAIFSLVEEIGDRLVRREKIKTEWYNFIYKIRGKIWPEIFSKFDQYAAFCREWHGSSDEVLKSVQKVRGEFDRMAG